MGTVTMEQLQRPFTVSIGSRYSYYHLLQGGINERFILRVINEYSISKFCGTDLCTVMQVRPLKEDLPRASWSSPGPSRPSKSPSLIQQGFAKYCQQTSMHGWQYIDSEGGTVAKERLI